MYFFSIFIIKSESIILNTIRWLKAELTPEAFILEKSLHVNCWTLDFIICMQPANSLQK